MRSVHVVMAAVSLLAIAAPAAAVRYRFDVVDTSATQIGVPLDNNTYTFFFDSMPMPAIYTGDTFSLLTDITFSAGVFGNYTFIDSQVDFLSDTLYGGLTTTFNFYSGEQLYTGPTSNPTFRLGTFVLDAGTITITDTTAVTPPPSAVPEPAGWAMMIAGFGLVGIGLRARRTRVAFG